MPPTTLRVHAPTVPGVSAQHAFQGKLPDVLAALAEPPGSDSRARKLDQVADEWFQAARWYVNEATTCEAMYNGLHYGFLDPKTSLWVGETLDADPQAVRITIPVTKAVVDQAVAMLTGDAAILKATAGKPGIAAAAAAETAKAFLDDIWRTHNLDDLYRDTGKSAFITGTSFVLLEYDKTVGPLKPVLGANGLPVMEPQSMPGAAEVDGNFVADDFPGVTFGAGSGGTATIEDAAFGASPALGMEGAEALAMPMGMPPLVPKMAPEGNLRYRMLMRDQVAFDPSSRRRGGQDGIGICVKWRESRTRLMELYPDKFPTLPETDRGNAFDKSHEERTQRSSPVTDSGMGSSTDKAEEDTLEVRVFYFRARPGAPRGDKIVLCSGKILEEAENDIYPSEEEIANGELWPIETSPVFDYLADTRENCPWGRSRIVDATPIQHGINGCYSKIMQHIGIMANVKYVLPAGLDWEPTDEPGQVARIPPKFYALTGGSPVQMTSPTPMPQEYIPTAENLISRLEYTIGINAASMGAPPSADPSGRLVQGLQQRDSSRIAPLKRSHDNQWGRMQTYALRLIRRYATGERLLRVVGQDKSVQMKFFQIAKLAAGTEVYAINDTSLPRNLQERTLMLSNVAQTLNTLPSEKAQQFYLETLNVPDVHEWLRRQSPHQSKAERVCMMLLQGENDDPEGMPVPPQWPPKTPIPAPWDNALIFKAELERLACGTEYLEAVKAEKAQQENGGQSPLEQRVVALWTYYTQQVNAQMQQMQAAQAPVLSGPGSKPEEAPPQEAAAA